MDPSRIVVRAVFAYMMLLILVRISGKHTVGKSSPFDFTLSLILGDMVDDLLWAEVDASVFVVGLGALLLVHTACDVARYRVAGRT